MFGILRSMLSLQLKNKKVDLRLKQTWERKSTTQIQKRYKVMSTTQEHQANERNIGLNTLLFSSNTVREYVLKLQYK